MLAISRCLSGNQISRVARSSPVCSRQRAVLQPGLEPSRSLFSTPRCYTRYTTVSYRQRRKDQVPTPDTIYALSTAPGRSAIAVVRISGPACLDVYGGLCPRQAFPHPRVATLRRIRDPTDDRRVLDSGALILYFPSPNTVTGEDVLELHLHGGPAIVRSILEAIPKCGNSRPRRRTAEFSHIRTADPGEFTKRAFYNGRLDLTQAEALGEVLAAETEQQRRLAVSGLNNGLASRYDSWRQILLLARGELEALIDFSEDQHFEEPLTELMQSVSTQVTRLRQEVAGHVLNASKGELLRNGITVALLGAPNAGKSSLLNRIVGREAAIVSSEAGTTRDIVDVTVDIAGWLVRLGDMAGLRTDHHDQTYKGTNLAVGATESGALGSVEQEGIRRAKERAFQSDLVIALIAVVQNTDGEFELSVNDDLLQAIRECNSRGKHMVFAVNKMDLVPSTHRRSVEDKILHQLRCMQVSANDTNVCFISCKPDAHAVDKAIDSSLSGVIDQNPQVIQRFLQRLGTEFSAMTAAVAGETLTNMTAQEAQSYWAAALSVSHRQREQLQQCLQHLDDFLRLNDSPADHGGSDDHGDKFITQSGPNVVEHSHYSDLHTDLVAEVADTIQPTNHVALSRTSHTRDQAATSVALDPVELHSTSADASNVIDSQIYVSDETGSDCDIVAAAEYLRYAADCLAKLTGRGDGGDVEDVLGVVFEK